MGYPDTLLGSMRNAFRVATDFSTPRLPFLPRSSAMPHSWATYRTNDSEAWIVRLSATKIQLACGSVATVAAMWTAKSTSVRVACTVGVITSPVATSKLPIRHWVPCRWYSNSRRSSWPGFIRLVGAIRSNAWMPVISSTLTVCVPSSAN